MTFLLRILKVIGLLLPDIIKGVEADKEKDSN